MSVQRARDEPAKASRRHQLLAAAAARFDAAGYAATTMSEIAAEAGLAKGTTYLYFRSKEALFLGLLLEELGEWVAVAAAEAERAEKAEKAETAEKAKRGLSESVAAALAQSVAARPRLVRLLALRAPLLEPGAGAEAVGRFRDRQLGRLEPLASRLEAAFPALGAGGGHGMTLRFLALAAGFADRIEPAAGGREPSAVDSRREVPQRDFTWEVASSMELLLSASKSAARPPAP